MKERRQIYETAGVNLVMLARRLVEQMGSQANAAIGQVLLRGSHSMKSPPRCEIGFVAAVVLGGINQIASAWRPLLSNAGFLLRIKGVFCHAAPIVEFMNSSGDSNRCELADLLVVVDKHFSGESVRLASLIQAKMANKAGHVILKGSSSTVQCNLYQNWPDFTFVEKSYPARIFDLRSGIGSNQSGTFGVIDRYSRSGKSSPPRWTQISARPKPTSALNFPELGTYIAEMVDGTISNFGRVATRSLETGWSELVEELLVTTYRRAFRHRLTLGEQRSARGTEAVACFISQDTGDIRHSIWFSSGGRPPFDRVETIEDDGDPSGISILHILVEQKPHRRGIKKRPKIKPNYTLRIRQDDTINTSQSETTNALESLLVKSDEIRLKVVGPGGLKNDVWEVFAYGKKEVLFKLWCQDLIDKFRID